jgi:hypothetical protein
LRYWRGEAQHRLRLWLNRGCAGGGTILLTCAPENENRAAAGKFRRRPLHRPWCGVKGHLQQYTWVQALFHTRTTDQAHIWYAKTGNKLHSAVICTTALDIALCAKLARFSATAHVPPAAGTIAHLRADHKCLGRLKPLHRLNLLCEAVDLRYRLRLIANTKSCDGLVRCCARASLDLEDRLGSDGYQRASSLGAHARSGPHYSADYRMLLGGMLIHLPDA